MADIKKKFIDILFEEEDDEQELRDDSYYDESPTETKVNSNTTLNAKDILYRKSGTSAFINLYDKPKNTEYVDNNIEIQNDEYEMSAQLSPIFGVIRENKKKEQNVSKEIIDSQTNKPSDSHLDIITSPIYGYGNKEDAIKDNYDVKGVCDDNYVEKEYCEDEELHNLFDDDYNNFDDSNDYLNDDSYDALSNNDESQEEISLYKLFEDDR